MRVAARGEIIVALFEYIGLVPVSVVCFELFRLYGYGVSFGLVGLKKVGLGEAYKLYRSLFYSHLFIVFGVGLLQVNLNGSLARNVARIGYGYRYFIGVSRGLYAEIGIGKIGIRFAVAEGEGHFLRVVPGVVLRAFYACGRSGVARVHNYVLVPRFVVAVADVYALLIYDVGVVIRVVAARVVGKARRVAVEFVRARVHRRGCGIAVVSICIDEFARRVDRARHYVVYGAERGVAAHSRPQAGIDVVRSDVLHRHRRAGVEHEYDRLEHAVLFEVDESFDCIHFVLREVEIVVFDMILPRVGAGIEPRVAVFVAVARNEEDGGVAVRRERGADVGIEAAPLLFAYPEFAVMGVGLIIRAVCVGVRKAA